MHMGRALPDASRTQNIVLPCVIPGVTPCITPCLLAYLNAQQSTKLCHEIVAERLVLRLLLQAIVARTLAVSCKTPGSIGALFVLPAPTSMTSHESSDRRKT